MKEFFKLVKSVLRLTYRFTTLPNRSRPKAEAFAPHPLAAIENPGKTLFFR